MTDSNDLWRRILEYLERQPASSAVEIAAALQVERGDASSTLFRMTKVFKNDGQIPANWSLITSDKGDEFEGIELDTEADDGNFENLLRDQESRQMGMFGSEPLSDSKSDDGRQRLRATETELRERLNKKSLVLEADIGDEEIEALEELLIEQFVRGGSVPDLAERFPASYVVYLVGKGIHSYDRGDLWSSYAPMIRDAKTERGPAFKRALKHLGLDALPALDLENSLPYVSRILAHGGLPRSNIKDLAESVLQRMSQGAMTADDTIAQWKHYPSMFQQLDKPAQRFVRFGGDPSRDFIQRIMDLMMLRPLSEIDPAAEALGLPQYVVVDVLDVLKKSKRTPRAIGRRLVAPSVSLDPMAISGPQLSLPALIDNFEYPSWRVTADGAQPMYLDGSTLSASIIPLEPARSWEVFLSDANGSASTWPIPGLSDDTAGILLFDPKTFELLRNQQVLHTDSIIALCASSSTITAMTADGEITPRVIQSNPPMPGSWGPYSRDCLDLDGVTSLSVTDDRGNVATIFVKTRVSPSLEGHPVIGATLLDGSAVFGEYPIIRLPHFDPTRRGLWRISIIEGDQPPVHLSDEDAREDGTFHFEDFFNQPGAVLEVNVRGSLGTDFKERFAVLEGLEFHRPKHVVAPQLDCTTQLQICSGGSIGVDIAPVFVGDARETTIALTSVETGGQDLEIRLEIPRLAWGIAQSGQALTLGARTIRLSTADIESDRDLTLVVSTGQPDEHLSLGLTRRSGETLGQADAIRTTSKGRWNFPLGKFIDSIRASDESVTHFSLKCQSLTETAAVISSVYEAQLHKATATFDMNGALLSVNVRENQAFRGRYIVLWSTDRPWEEPLWASIPDDQKDDLNTYVEGLLPGHHHLLLTLDDPSWRTPHRPTHSTPLCWRVPLGTDEEVEDWLTTPRGESSSTQLELFLADILDAELLLSGRSTFPTEPDHLAAALIDIAGQSKSSIANSDQISPILTLAHDDSADFWKSFGRRTRDCADDVLLPLAILTLPLALDSVSQTTDSSTRSVLWDKFPIIGAALDFASSADDAVDRCMQRLMWHPAMTSDRPSSFGKVDTQFLSMTAGQIQAIGAQTAGHSMSPRFFVIDEYQLPANLEWLESAALDPSEIVSWVNRALRQEPQLEDLSIHQYESSMGYLDERRPAVPRPDKTENAKTRMPYATLATALEMVFCKEERAAPRRLLIQAASFAPRLVMHDIILALAVACRREDQQSD